MWLIRKMWASTGQACAPFIWTPQRHGRDAFSFFCGASHWREAVSAPRPYDPCMPSNLKPQMACGITLLGNTQAFFFSVFFFLLKGGCKRLAGRLGSGCSWSQGSGSKHALVNQLF